MFTKPKSVMNLEEKLNQRRQARKSNIDKALNERKRLQDQLNSKTPQSDKPTPTVNHPNQDISKPITRTSDLQHGESFKAVQHINYPDTNPDLCIFMCHANEDKAEVREIKRQLEMEGLNPWLDEDDILPGEEWGFAIQKALSISKVTLVFLSSNSINKRGYVQKEIKIALELLDYVPEDQIYLIPVLLEDCPIPTRLKKIQAVKLYESNGFSKLLKSLRHTLRE